MAKKINVKLILELRGNGMGRNAIARTRHISVNSVGDVFHKADENGISYEDVRDMDEDSVYRMFYPDKFVQESMYAQPDYGYVHQELKRVGVTLSSSGRNTRTSAGRLAAFPWDTRNTAKDTATIPL